MREPYDIRDSHSSCKKINYEYKSMSYIIIPFMRKTNRIYKELRFSRKEI